MQRIFFVTAILFSAGSSALAGPLVEIPLGIPGAAFVAVYSTGQREKAVQAAMGLATRPALGVPVSLTPNAPYATDGSHLSFWKPSFVIGTPAGGEAGINFWGKYQDGHMNVALAAANSVLLDCRMPSAGNITYKIYAGNGGTPRRQGDRPLRDGHFLLMVTGLKRAEPQSVELWPKPRTQPVGIFGCDISAINPERRHP
jgi:hypothetical protein